MANSQNRAVRHARSIFLGFRDCQMGAAAAETALTIMWFLLIILGIIQFTLTLHAKALVNYAAYSAARAGIVYNGTETSEGREKMKQAAAVALTPLFSASDDLGALVLGYGKAYLFRSRMPIPLGGFSVEIVSPAASRFSSGYSKRFFPEYRRYDATAGNAAERKLLDDNLLTVRISYGFRLRVPFVNRILSPFAPFPYTKLSSTHSMRMQSDAFTE